MGRRIVNTLTPGRCLAALAVWICVSALRSWGTPWEQAANTEALRWLVGIGLAFGISLVNSRLGQLAQSLCILLAVLILGVLFGGRLANGLVAGFYGDHQLCASALLALIPFSAALSFASPKTTWRWGAQTVSLLALICLAMTETRSAWAGALAGSVVFALLWLRFSPIIESRKRRFFAHTLPILIAATLGGLLMIAINGTGDIHPIAKRTATVSTLQKDGSWQWRLETWRGDLPMIARQPLFGWGIGHYASAHWAFTHLGAHLRPSERPSLEDQAHDFYLQTTADMGLVGVALYLAMLFAFVRQALAKLKARAERTRGFSLTDALLIASISLVIGQSIDAIASPSWQFAEVSLLFWLGLGAGMAALSRCAKAGSDIVIPARGRRVLQLCASGAAAIFLTAQVLPIGLLSPAEAYLVPSNWQFQYNSSNTTATATAQAGQAVSFDLTPHYLANGVSYYPDVTFDNASSTDQTTFKLIPQAGQTIDSSFGAANLTDPSLDQRNILTLSSADIGKTLDIGAVYYEQKPGTPPYYRFVYIEKLTVLP